MTDFNLPMVIEQEDDKPIPLRRSDMEELSIAVAEEVSRFINKILSTPKGVITRGQVLQVERFIKEYFRHWYRGKYEYVSVTVDHPWMRSKQCSEGSIFNLTLDLFEQEFIADPDIMESDCTMTFVVESQEGDFGTGHNVTRFVTERKYVWYE